VRKLAPMPHTRSILLLFALTAAFGVITGSARSDPGIVREPRYAGSSGFYPADPDALGNMIQELAEKAQHTATVLPSGARLRGLILPHAGYIYSGWTAAHAGPVLADSAAGRIILMGPDHRIGFQNGAVSHAAYFRTPLGMIPVADEDCRQLAASGLFRHIDAADAAEHSLEVVLPLLQYFCKPFALVPIVLGPCDIETIAAAIAPIVDEQTLIVASSDLSHGLTYRQAVATDAETVRIILHGKADQLLADSHRACGRYPVAVLLHIARKNGWKPLLLHASNSGDTAGPRSRVVGYAAIAFYEENHMSPGDTQNASLTQEQGRALVRLARQTIRKALDLPPAESGDDTPAETLAGEIFQKHRGTFVTLHKDGALRGCIGSLLPDTPLAESVRKNAVNAAFRDPRFPAVTREEMDDLDIEVSILTPPRPLAYKDPADLTARLRAGIDGLIIRKGGASATFLPQVWKQLPQPADFLSHLCRKAGLPADAWKTMDIEVQTYQVQYFEER
jgi:MEMO1 family protein